MSDTVNSHLARNQIVCLWITAFLIMRVLELSFKMSEICLICSLLLLVMSLAEGLSDSHVTSRANASII